MSPEAKTLIILSGYFCIAPAPFVAILPLLNIIDPLYLLISMLGYAALTAMVGIYFVVPRVYRMFWKGELKI